MASLLEPPNGPRTTLLPPTVHDPTVVPSCRLPSPHRVPACPVRDTSQIPYRVKAAQEEGKGGGGALAGVFHFFAHSSAVAAGVEGGRRRNGLRQE